MKNLWHLNKVGFIIPFLLGLIIVFLSFSGLLQSTEDRLYDLYYQLRGPLDPGEDLVIVAIDEKSIAEIGPLPWSREVHAELLEELELAGVVAFDLLFDFPDEARADNLFIRAVEKNGNVVLASMFIYNQVDSGEWYQSLVLPFQELTGGAASIGFINVPVDRGNMIRKITVVDTNYYATLYPSFSLAIALQSLELQPEQLLIDNNHLVAGSLTIPTNQENQGYIHYWGPGGTFPTYSYVDVLHELYPQETWAGKTVLIGVTTPAAMDYFETPYTSGNLILQGSLPSAGVEVHASAVKTYLDSRSIRKASLITDLILLAVAWLTTLYLARRFSPLPALGVILLLALIFSGLAYLCWERGHLIVNLAAVLLIIASIYMNSAISSFISSERERIWIRETFSRYISPDYVTELVKNPESIKLGGQKALITVIFADLRDFTAYCEAESPETIINKLNGFFTEMTAAVFNHGGTLDKYLGDGFMAFFGAPVSDAEHALSAVSAAIEMSSRMTVLNARWNEKGEKTFKMGIGINSGQAVIGNIGSESRMDYSAMGRDVNIASRLDALNKSYNTEIMIGESTVSMVDPQKLPTGWEFYALSEEQLPGLSGKIKVYSLKNRQEL
jgi:adenylate cyclase